MTTAALPLLDAAADYVPVAGARRSELVAYRRLLRVLGRPVRQPDAGATAPVLLVPGFLSGDLSLALPARALRRVGVRTFRSGIGANVGCTEDMVVRLVARLEAVAAAEGRPVALVGHSRGGMVAALAARRRPDLVARLVVLSAPVTGTLAVASHVRKQLELLVRLHARGLGRVLASDCITGECATRVADELTTPFPPSVPFLSVYSRNDAILDWRTCLDPAAELVESDAGHVGMACDPAVIALLVDRLSAPAARTAAA